jgi:hypothetical protein
LPQPLMEVATNNTTQSAIALDELQTEGTDINYELDEELFKKTDCKNTNKGSKSARKRFTEYRISKWNDKRDVNILGDRELAIQCAKYCTQLKKLDGGPLALNSISAYMSDLQRWLNETRSAAFFTSDQKFEKVSFVAVLFCFLK